MLKAVRHLLNSSHKPFILPNISNRPPNVNYSSSILASKTLNTLYIGRQNIYTNLVTQCQYKKIQVIEEDDEIEPTLETENENRFAHLDWVSKLSTFNDENFLDIMSTLFHNDKSLAVPVVILKKYDNEFIRRAAHWKPETFIEHLKRYHDVGLHPKSKIYKYAMKRRLNGVLTIELPKILIYLQIMNERKTWVPSFYRVYDIEYTLEKYIEAMRWSEVNEFLIPIFASSKAIVSDRLNKQLCNKFIEEVGETPTASIKLYLDILCLKGTSNSRNPAFLTPWLIKLLRSLMKQMNRLDLACASKMTLLCSRFHIYDLEILQSAADKFLTTLASDENTDMNDIDVIVEGLTYFNFPYGRENGKSSVTHDIFYNQLIDALKSPEFKEKIMANIRSTCKILSNLAIVGIYPVEVIDFVMCRKNIRLGYKKLDEYNLPKEIRILLGGIINDKVACNASKNDMNPCIRHVENHLKSFPEILRKHEFTCPETAEVPRYLSPYNRVLFNTRALLDDILGGIKYSHICFRLPYFSRANNAFWIDEKNKILEVPDVLHNELSYNTKKYDDCCNMVVFETKCRYMDYEPMYMGEEIAKVRQLKKLGIRVISVPQQGWLELECEEKKKVLTELIFDNKDENEFQDDKYQSQ